MDQKKLAEYFLKSQRPLVFAGNGLRRQSKELVALLNQLEIPLILSTHAKGAVDEEEECFYGCFGFASPESTMNFIKNYKPDLTLFLATSLGELATQGWSSELMGAQVKIHINRDEQFFRKHLPMTYCEQGMISDVVQALHLVVSEKPSFEIFSSFPKTQKHVVLDQEELSMNPIKPESLVDLLPVLLPENCLVVSDIGNSMAWLMNRFQNTNGQELYVPIAMGSMGSGIGMAIGAKLANPSRPVVCITGDCAMVMHGAEILTAVENGISLVFIVLNDGGHGMVDHGHKIIGVGDAKVRFQTKVDFVQYAQSFGAAGLKIRNLSELTKVSIEELLSASKPTVLDLDINSKSVPPILARARVLGQADLVKR